MSQGHEQLLDALSDVGEANPAGIAEWLTEALLDVAAKLNDDPKYRQLFEEAMTGAIHERFGGEIAVGRGEDKRVFWHRLGSPLIDRDGNIYVVRFDDEQKLQAYVVAPQDERGRSIDVCRPLTYDSQMSPDGGKVRLDFVNGAHHYMPQNIEHVDEGFAKGRDGILMQLAGGSVEGWLHDGQTGELGRLFTPEEVVRAAEFINLGDEPKVAA